MLSQEQGKKLLVLARQSIKNALDSEVLDLNDYVEFSQSCGVFVTIKQHGELRGCIGYPQAIYPLREAVSKAAMAAAFEDPRFESLKKEDFDSLKFEVSVLTAPKLVEHHSSLDIPNKIIIGVDGLIVKKGHYSGLLLPQVATEQKWDAEQFLAFTCQKAGLEKDCWQNSNTQVYSFKAQIFKEKE
ncbi:TIGR00296 family protein [Candidatus Woesearchaeota archaeon]|nr:TIGR00296 family protein [Candidatus Woesearchaeota archaeon]